MKRDIIDRLDRLVRSMDAGHPIDHTDRQHYLLDVHQLHHVYHERASACHYALRLARYETERDNK